MHPALVPCDLCPHPRAAHAPTDETLCRISGCECPGYATAAPTQPVEEEQPRGVFLVIPDGYTMTVTLTPVTP